LLSASGPLFGLWINRRHSPRLRPGDLVVVLTDKHVTAVGELLELTPSGARLVGNHAETLAVTESNHRMLKIGCVVLA
jgi:hypothetical protein